MRLLQGLKGGDLFLNSRLARRILLLFFTCALLPVVAITVLAFRQVMSNLDSQSRARLHQQSKTVAMSIVERLLFLSADLELAALQVQQGLVADADQPDFVGVHLGSHFRDIRVLEGANDPRTAFDNPNLPQSLDVEQLEHLASGGALIVTAPTGELMTDLILIRRIEPNSRDSRTIWGRVHGEYLWSIGPGGTLPPRTELCVYDSQGSTLVRSVAIPADVVPDIAQSIAEADVRWIEWSTEDGDYLAGFWPIPMETNYQTATWTVVVSESTDQVNLPVLSFRRDFPLAILLSLWIVLLLGIGQIRRSTDPLQKLRDGTRRLADGDFDARVRISSGDEFQDLADAFNGMSGQLGRQFDLLQALANIGRTALTSLDPAEIARAASLNVRSTLAASSLQITILDTQEPGVAVNHLMVQRSDHVDVIGPARSQAPRDLIQEERVEHAAGGRRSGSIEALMVKPAPEGRQLAAFPIHAENRPLGYLILTAAAGETFTDSHLEVAREIADQLALALRQAMLRHEVEAERKRLSRLIEHLPSGVLVLDAMFRVLTANRIGRAYLPVLSPGRAGEPIETLAGRSITELVEPPSEGDHHELRVESPKVRIFESAGARLSVGTGFEQYIIVLRDVSHDRLVEESLRRQERLAAVGELAAGIAHDFNNILQGTMMAGELLAMMEELPPAARSLAQDVTAEGHRGARLIRQILEFSRASDQPHEAIDVAELVKETSRLLRRTIPASIEIDVQVGEGEHQVLADPVQIQQVVTNLAVNARDAMPNGGDLRLTINSLELHPSDTLPTHRLRPGDWVVLSVSDTGTGIPEDARSRIFEPFFSTKAPGQGTGLGLAQVYGVVTHLGGVIEVESAEEFGTTFTVFLPRSRDIDQPADTREPSQLARGHGEVILVADDNHFLCRNTAEALQRIGYETQAETDGEAAIEAFEASPNSYDVVLVDTIMPKVSGVEIVRRVKRLRPSVPVVLMSAYPLTSHLEELRAAGMDSWISKPFSMWNLAEVLRRVLGQFSELFEEDGITR